MMKEINGVKIEWIDGNAYVRLNEYEKLLSTNEEIDTEDIVRKNVEHSLKNAEKILYKIDAEIDKMEGKEIYKAMENVQQLLLDWNFVGHTFASYGLQDWIGTDTTEKEE